MISAWLNLPSWQLILVLAAAFGAFGLMLYALLFRVLPRDLVLRHGGLVAPFFTAFSVLFALLTGFTANDTWERNRNAARAVLAEQDGLLDVYYLSLAAVTEMSAIRDTARTYIDLVVQEEWPRLGDHARSDDAEAALGRLLTLVAEPRVASESGVALQGALVQSVLKLRSARYDRLAISSSRSDELKWVSVLLLGMLTQLSLALTHLDKGRAQLAATLLYACAVVAALGPVASREYPFHGDEGVTAAPLLAARAIMVR